LAPVRRSTDINPFGPEKYKTKIEEEVPPTAIYDQGLARLKKGDDDGAAKKFTDLGKQYPLFGLVEKGIADDDLFAISRRFIHRRRAIGRTYVKLYPDTPETAYAIYLGAMSYYDQIPDISRDQDRAERPWRCFGRSSKIPNSEYVADAKFKIQVTRDQIAGKEMSVGGLSDAPQLYRRHQSLPQRADQLSDEPPCRGGLYRLTEAYLGLGITGEAQTAAAVLGHNFPDGQWYKDAFALLKAAVFRRTRIRLPGCRKSITRSCPADWAKALLMLARLAIRDIVLIDQLDLEFAAGLSILTGETGAGKSILLDALSLALGARAMARWCARGRRKAR